MAVIGAGPAGLVAAWRAARAGHRITVVERAESVGGMAASFEVAGIRVDHGSHRLHPSIAPHLRAALADLLGDDLQVRPRNGRIRLRGRWVAFPLRPTDLLTRLPPAFALRAGRDALVSPLRRPRQDTFAEVVRAGLGPTVADGFYRPYARKLWGCEPEELAGELARRRVSAATPGDVLRRLRPGRGERPHFLYPRRGFGQIVERLAEAAVDAGADLRLGTAVDRVALADDGVKLTLGDGLVLGADRVWSTAPLPALARRLDPPPPPAVLAAADRLVHRALVLVYLVLERRRYTSFDAHYFPGEDVALARLSEPRNYRDDPTQPDDRTVLCAEVPCSVGDDTWRAEPDALGAAVAADLEAQGLPPAEPVAVEVRRLPRVYPVYRRGFEWDLSALDLWAGSRPGLLTFGRQGLFVPDNTHHALAMGWEAAACLAGDGTFDHHRWARARAGFRDFVVED